MTDEELIEQMREAVTYDDEYLWDRLSIKASHSGEVSE